MRVFFLLLLLFAAGRFYGQRIENMVIITTDGLRWQEVFSGMDSAIANNNRFNQWDSAGIYNCYWDTAATERRKKLLPFLWSVIENKGQLYGNRNAGCKVNVANRYWFSYPGYNEIFTGYPDTLVNSNHYKPNPNTNVLEFLNKQNLLKGKVAAFGAWNAFERILNRERNKMPVRNAFDKPLPVSGYMADMLQDSYKPFGNEECLDVFTHYQAMDYLKNKKPRVLYIAYGETDEWAHAGKYKDYLSAATQVDKWISDIWNYLQSDPQYKNKTALLITTDHGRGDKIKEEWVTHGEGLTGADQIWFAVLGPGIPVKGEVKKDIQLYQQQLAQTIASLMGYRFTCEHRVAEAINLVP